jgi:hypothetical protein
MERPNEPTLLDMPTELRNRILELAVFHEEAGGIISPGPDDVSIPFVTSISGQRFVAFDYIHPCIPDDSKLPTWAGGPGSQGHHLMKTWLQSPNWRSNHLCKLDCLVQPSITRVNKQLLSETLPIFYGVNHIYIELANFELTRGNMESEPAQGQIEIGRAPCDWWRAISDKHLGLVHELTIVGQKVYEDEGIAIKYNQSQGTELTRT